MTNCYAPGDRDDYMSVKKSKYERKMRKRNPEWGKSTGAMGRVAGVEIKPLTEADIELLKSAPIPPHLRGFIRSIVE